MRHLEPVIWTKGDLLNPQHLQLQDRFLEDTFSFQMEALVFRPWGFTRLRIDESALASGQFAISEASGILPDGLLFDIPKSETGPPARPISPAFADDQNTLDVYLAVPRYRDFGVNVSNNGRDTDARYRAEYVMVRDENTGLSEKPVPIARKEFRVLFEGEGAALETGPQAGARGNSLRIARIKRVAPGMFQTDDRFVPPLLNFAASDYLVTIARRIIEILNSRSRDLSGTRREKSQSLADFSTADIANFWLLYSINSHFPLFRHLFETGGHPERLYSAMLALAGALTTFSVRIHPADLLVYDHDELGRCFADLDEKLRLLLATVAPSNFVSLPLRVTQPFVHTTPIDDERLLEGTRLFLGFSCKLKESEIVARVPHLVKVCSATHIDRLIRQALEGVTLEHENKPPAGFPIKLDYQYFSLTRSGAAWESILRARNFAAYIPAEFPDPKAELFVVLPAEA